MFNRFSQYLGNFSSPFHQTLGFGKLSWQPAANQLVDFSTNYRREHEVRDFGNQASFESATDLRNWVYGSTLRHQWNSSSALNQAANQYDKFTTAFRACPDLSRTA